MKRCCANSTALATLALLSLAAPVLRAQFQPPAPDELKMTADPSAPGASAVYLYREQTDNLLDRYQTVYCRIKVLTEKGKELATISIPFEHGNMVLTDIQARTIHADGTVVPFTGTPADLMDVKVKGFQIDSMVFTLPSVEVGSILEYRWKLKYKDGVYLEDPVWDVQQHYFVHKAHYFFKPYGLTELATLTHLAAGARVIRDSSGAYTLDVHDVPPTPDEDWMPPLNTFKWDVRFYYSRFANAKEFWEAMEKNWDQSISEVTAPTGGIKKIAAGIVTPGDPDLKKAMALYSAVEKLNNTDFSRRKSEAERKKEKLKQISKVEDVWKQQSGSGDDIALLYVALARAAGLQASPALVVDRDQAMFEREFLSAQQLDDYLALVLIDGKEIFVDPGQKMCPFGLLHWKHTLASGLRLTDKGAILFTTPGSPYKGAVTSRFADLTIDPSGNVKGTVRISMTGPRALYWRQLTLGNDQDEVKKQFNESMKESIPEGVQAEFDHFLALDDCEANLIAVVQVSGSLGSATGKRFFLPSQFFESRGRHPFVTVDKRLTPIDVHYPELVQDEVTYHLPAGFTLESAPPLGGASWPDHALLKIGSSPSGDSVKVMRSLAYNYTLLDAKAYPDLHDFYQKVATADQQQIVLTRTPAAKGN